CAFTRRMKLSRAEQAPGTSPASSEDCASRILSLRAEPGPRPVTADSRSASCSPAPLTWTMNEPEAVLPVESVAVQLTVVSPIGNVLPEGGSQSTGTSPSTASVALAEYVTVAPAGPGASTESVP